MKTRICVQGLGASVRILPWSVKVSYVGESNVAASITANNVVLDWGYICSILYVKHSSGMLAMNYLGPTVGVRLDCFGGSRGRGVLGKS